MERGDEEADEGEGEEDQGEIAEEVSVEYPGADLGVAADAGLAGDEGGQDQKQDPIRQSGHACPRSRIEDNSARDPGQRISKAEPGAMSRREMHPALPTGLERLFQVNIK
jgi:hypothetical protein